MSKWLKLSEYQPDTGDAVRLFHPEWKCVDFNPTGTIEGTVLLDMDDDRNVFVGAFWDADQDCYVTRECLPTHWCYPDSPETP